MNGWSIAGISVAVIGILVIILGAMLQSIDLSSPDFMSFATREIMKRGKKMVIIIISILVALCLITWGVITYLGRSQTLSVKSIENFNDDLYLIRLTKPDNVTWEAGSYAQFTLHDVKENAQETTDVISSASMSNDKNKQNSGWGAITSYPNEDGNFIFTPHNGGFF